MKTYCRLELLSPYSNKCIPLKVENFFVKKHNSYIKNICTLNKNYFLVLFENSLSGTKKNFFCFVDWVVVYGIKKLSI